MNRRLIVILTVFSCWAVNCSAQNLSLHLNLDSNTFIESQDIWVTASVTNSSSDTQRVQSLILINTGGGIRFILREGDGKEIPEPGRLATDDWGKTGIPPGDSLTESFNLMGVFSTSGSKDPAIYNHSVHYLKAGVYTLDAKTLNGKDTLRAATVRFEVRQPPVEEVEVLQLLKTADLAFGKRDKKSNEQYENIIKQYPNSVYIPYVYERLIFIYRWVKVDKSHELDLVEKFALQHPNNRGAMREIQNYLPEFVKFNRKGVIEKIARKYPTTKVGKYCKSKLQELNTRK